MAAALGGCMPGWDGAVDWTDLGATSQGAFNRACADEWASTRASLEGRQLEEALATCSEVQEGLPDTTCDTLRTLYVPTR